MTLLFQLTSTHRLALAAQLLTDNASISATQTWEETMKAVNALEIQLFIQNSIPILL